MTSWSVSCYFKQMILPDRLKNPRALMSIGMACLLPALLWPRFVHPTAAGLDLADFVRGVLFGLSFGMNLWSVALTARQRPLR